MEAKKFLRYKMLYTPIKNFSRLYRNRPFRTSTKSLDRALSLYIIIREVGSSNIRASITIAHVCEFFKMYQMSLNSDTS